jgi:hypothetical protein
MAKKPAKKAEEKKKAPAEDKASKVITMRPLTAGLTATRERTILEPSKLLPL